MRFRVALRCAAKPEHKLHLFAAQQRSTAGQPATGCGWCLHSDSPNTLSASPGRHATNFEYNGMMRCATKLPLLTTGCGDREAKGGYLQSVNGFDRHQAMQHAHASLRVSMDRAPSQSTAYLANTHTVSSKTQCTACTAYRSLPLVERPAD